MVDDINNIDRTHRLGPLVDDTAIGEEIKGRDLAIVLSRYDLGSIERIMDYQKGSRRSAKMMLKTSSGSFLLKRRASGRDDQSQVSFAHAVQQMLSKHRFPVAGLVESLEGNTLVNHEGRTYELFRFIQGDRFDKSNPAAAESGRVLAHFHDILQNYPEEPSAKQTSFHQGIKVLDLLDELYEVLMKSEDAKSCEGISDTLNYLQEQYKISHKTVETAGFSNLPPSIVHGDWHPGNMLYKDGEIIAVIDFDSLRVNPRITDIANGVLQFSMRMGEPEGVDSWPDSFRGHTIQSMVQAYDQFTKIPLMSSERSMLPWLMIEAFIVESVIPIHRTGAFGRIKGSSFLRMVERKIKWLIPRSSRVIEVIQPSIGEEETFS
ncbi:MAG: phosphotransferase [Planctomycetota bacterium]|nr:phosphotransferase [Planctomycetota bacterium]